MEGGAKKKHLTFCLFHAPTPPPDFLPDVAPFVKGMGGVGPKLCGQNAMGPPCPTHQLWLFSSAKENHPKMPVRDPQNEFPEFLGSAFFWHSYIPPFLGILFSFFCPVHPTLPQPIFFPRIPSFWDLIVEKRQPAGAGFWTGGPPTGKKENPFLLARKKR